VAASAAVRKGAIRSRSSLTNWIERRELLARWRPLDRRSVRQNPSPTTQPARRARPRRTPERRGERRDQGRARLSVHPSAYVAGHDAPLIGERAARRGRCAMECGDERPVGLT
jgi:hypothetical protein